MLFCSNFNGTWDQYIDAFSDGVAKGLDYYWYASVKYPRSIPITTFKSYIVLNQFDTNYYYNATPGAAQRDIKAALRVRAEITHLEQVHAAGDKAAFAKAYRASLAKLQNSLSSQGYAPIASTDTWNADEARQPYVLHQKAAREAPPPKP